MVDFIWELHGEERKNQCNFTYVSQDVSQYFWNAYG
jgi:hypothetical protein